MSTPNLFRFGLVLWFSLPAVAHATRRLAVSEAALSDHVRYLASNKLEGRGIGTEGIQQAAQYLADHFARIGLQPAGDEGSFFQSFEIPFGKEITPQCRLQFSGQAPDLDLKQGTDFIPLPFSTAEPFSGPLAFVGFGIHAPDRDHDDYEQVDVNGKALLMFRYEPANWSREGEPHTPNAYFTTKSAVARERGAAALIIVNPPSDGDDDNDELYTFSTARDYGLPMMQLKRDSAETLLQAGGLGSLDELHRRCEESEAVSADLAGMKASGDPGIAERSTSVRNVVAVLPGAGPDADEFVVFGAHYDHLGNVPPTMRPRRPGTFDPADAQIHNGADDNASGTAAILEIARLYAVSIRKPRRSLMFIGFTAEESGLWGSQHFVDHPTVPLGKIVAMINLDMIGRLEGKPIQIFGTGTAEEFDELVTQCARERKVEIAARSAGLAPSDHVPFYGKNIPVLFAFTGLHTDYHKPGDDADKIDYSGMVQITGYIKTIGDGIIERDARPTYVKTVELTAPGPRLKVKLGIMPSYTDDGKKGWVIRSVEAGGAAEKAGMKAGDRILSIDGHSVSDIFDYMRAVEDHEPGDRVEIIIFRNDKRMTLNVTLQAR